jgi:hypothetical protein
MGRHRAGKICKPPSHGTGEECLTVVAALPHGELREKKSAMHQLWHEDVTCRLECLQFCPSVRESR